MDRSREVAWTLIVVAAIAGFFSAAPCYGAESQGQGGATFVTLGAALGTFMDIGPRAGLEYRSPAGPGVGAAVGINFLSLFTGGGVVITAEALAILPLFRFGRSGALDLALGVPWSIWPTSPGPGIWILVGGATRLRFELGSRWSLLVRAGAGCTFIYDQAGSQTWADNGYVLPDLGIGAAFRL